MKKLFALCLSLMLALSLCAPFAVSADGEPVISGAEETKFEFENYLENIAYADGSKHTPNLATNQPAYADRLQNFSNGNMIYYGSKTNLDVVFTFPVKFVAKGTYQMKLIGIYNKTNISPLTLQVGTSEFKPTLENGKNLEKAGPFSYPMYEWTFDITVAEAGVQNIVLTADYHYNLSHDRNQATYGYDYFSFVPVEVEAEVEPAPEPEPEPVDSVTIDGVIAENVNGSTMIPLRSVMEGLGYTVTWHAESRSIDLIKGAQFITMTLDIDGYAFSRRAPQQLGACPTLVGDSTYVPLNFISEIIGGEYAENEDGTYKIAIPLS